MMKKTAADLRDKVHDMITNAILDSNGTQAALLETVSTSPCTADASNDHHFFESRAETHPMPPHGYDTSPPNQSLPPSTNYRASTPQSYSFEPIRQATTPQTSRSQTSTLRNAPVKMPIPAANIHSQNYKSIAPAPTKSTLQVRPPDRNPASSFSAQLPRAQSFSREPMGDVPQQTPGLLSASNTPDHQEAKRKAAESSAINGASHARKRQRANKLAAVALHASASQSPVDQRDHASQPSNFMQERITQRVITFEELYQDGKAEYKHKIFKHKEGSDDWYIVKCDEHNMHFGFDNPVHGAAKHINSPQHGKMPMQHDLAVQIYGFLVKDCTDELAEKNNDVFAKELEKGYQVLKPKSLSRRSPAKPRGVKR
ncbi:hypothetical protein F5883DRAFT_575046 [Diaporthe sp. PMI_573]|nr:hypothetical protein F5883DRAFT_575046 [Diaporthaceae sp. PMI_573]